MEDTLSSAQHLTRSMTRRYVFAIVVIALLATTNFYIFSQVNKGLELTGLLVNSSGKQRMLSQSIALQAVQVHRIQFGNSTDEAQLDDKKRLLLSLIAQMNDINQQLSSGQLSNGLTVNLSPTIRQLYFGDLQITQRVETYLALATQFTQSANFSDSHRLSQQLVDTVRTLVTDLDKLPSQYQQEGEGRVERVKWFQRLAWGITLIVLLLEGVLVFNPMVRLINRQMKRNEEHHQELETLNNHLTNVAQKDALTGAFNRLTLETQIEQCIDQFEQQQIPFGIMMLDIDFFKKVNDRYGHDMGDVVLKELVHLLNSLLYASDKIFRAGGEEFVILLNQIHRDALLAKAEQVRQTVENHTFKLNHVQLKKTISIGVYHSDCTVDKHVKTLLKMTDNALYMAKHQGRNRVVLANQHEHLALNQPKPMSIEIIFTDASLTQVMSVDAGIQSLCGLTPSQLINEPNAWLNAIYSEDVPSMQRIAVQPQGSLQNPLTVRIHQQAQTHILAVICKEVMANGACVFNLYNVKQLFKQQSEDTMANNLNAMLENTTDFIYFKDRYHLYTAASQTQVAFSKVTTREAFVGKTDYELFDDAISHACFMLEQQIFEGKLPMVASMESITDNEGNPCWVDNRKYPIKNSQGQIVGLFGVARVISEWEYQNWLAKQAKVSQTEA